MWVSSKQEYKGTSPYGCVTAQSIDCSQYTIANLLTADWILFLKAFISVLAGIRDKLHLSMLSNEGPLGG